MVVVAAFVEVLAVIVDVAVTGVVDDAATGVVASLGNDEVLGSVIKSSRHKVVIRVDAPIVDIVATANGQGAFFIADALGGDSPAGHHREVDRPVPGGKAPAGHHRARILFMK